MIFKLSTYSGDLYIVPEGTEAPSYLTEITTIVGDEQTAIAKLQETRTQVLTQEAHRFSISHVIINGSNTEWKVCDLDNDTENGEYHVFNHTTGQYEPFLSLSAAKARMEQLKLEFLTSCNLDEYVALDGFPELIEHDDSIIPRTIL